MKSCLENRRNKVKIFGIMLVKDEVDIVGDVLKDAEKWADKIFILDNGSTDGTWELIQSLKNDIIVPWKQYFGEYNNGLRANVYNEFKHLSKPDDWWCFKLDADEFFPENPREFLAKIPKNCHWVGKRSVDFVITKEDAEEYVFTGDFSNDRKHIKYIIPTCESEGRFFRYRKGLKWTNNPLNHYPPHIGVQADELIVVYHYRDRSPEQIKKRIRLRMQTEAFRNGWSWGYKSGEWNPPSRKDFILCPNTLDEIKKMPANLGSFKQTPLKNLIKRVLIKLRLYN